MPREFKILHTQIVRKPPYNDACMWGVLDGETEKFKIFDEEYKEREKALFGYFGIDFVEIQQPLVRELLHQLAIAHGFKGFKIRPFRENSDNEWNGKKGEILFLRMHIEKLKLKQAGKRHDFRTCAGNIVNQNYPEYTKNSDTLYARFQEIKKGNPDIPNIKRMVQTGDYTVETLERLLEVIS